jgi:hypothetical protein
VFLGFADSEGSRSAVRQRESDLRFVQAPIAMLWDFGRLSYRASLDGFRERRGRHE